MTNNQDMIDELIEDLNFLKMTNNPMPTNIFNSIQDLTDQIDMFRFIAKAEDFEKEYKMREKKARKWI